MILFLSTCYLKLLQPKCTQQSAMYYETSKVLLFTHEKYYANPSKLFYPLKKINKIPNK